MRALITIVLLLTVSPFIATLTLVCWKPERWGDTLNPLTILFMGYFGMLTFPGIPLYLIAVVATPLVMSAVSKHQRFASLSLVPLLSFAFLIGAAVGLGIMAPVTVQTAKQGSLDLTLNWAAAGAVSGGFTLSLIVMVYRKFAK